MAPPSNASRNLIPTGQNLPSSSPSQLPEILVHSGSHCGDHLSVRDVHRLSNELDRLAEAMPSATALSGKDARQIALAIKELKQLVKTALAVNKPIAF